MTKEEAFVMVDLLESLGVGILVSLGIGLVTFVVKLVPYLICGFDDTDDNK